MCAECGCGITEEARDESTGREASEQQETA
jgi:transcription initiation factor TFIIIB Brf1 subunit/transcription initiation factor TFIIB